MRPALVAVVVASTSANAAPLERLVGDYRGALVWRQCTAPGEKVVRVAVDVVNGVMTIDLTPVGAALRIFSLQQDAAAWSAQDGDLSVQVSQNKANTVDLAIRYDSGCTARGRLVRGSTAVAACDALIGWSRIEATCSKAGDKLEDAAALAAATWKKSDAARCTARADKLARAMVDAGCVPHPDPMIGVRAVQCRSLADATAKLARCGRVPREIMQRLSSNADALVAASQTAERATLPFVERQCQDARAALAGTAVQFQCQL